MRRAVRNRIEGPFSISFPASGPVFSCFVSSSARRVLKIPRIGYSDDFGGVAQLDVVREALRGFADSNGIRSVRLKILKCDAGPGVEFLGAAAHLSDGSRDAVADASISHEGAQELAEMVDDALKVNEASDKLRFAYCSFGSSWVGGPETLVHIDVLPWWGTRGGGT